MEEEVNSLTGVDFVNIIQVNYDWGDTEDKLHRWKLVINTAKCLAWVYTYNPALTKLGTTEVEFYRDTSMRLCIRKPKRKEPQSEV